MEPDTTTSADIPSYSAQFITEYGGEEGAAWLRDLPALLAEFL